MFKFKEAKRKMPFLVQHLTEDSDEEFIEDDESPDDHIDLLLWEQGIDLDSLSDSSSQLDSDMEEEAENIEMN